MLVCMLLFFVSVMPARDNVHNLIPFDARSLCLISYNILRLVRFLGSID
jgi:hypothetical protein